MTARVPSSFLTGKKMITQQELITTLHYDADAGLFRWIAPCRRVGKMGIASLKASSKGYVIIRIRGKKYSAHRLAWLWMTGEWPALDIDHIDGDKTNNKWENLRLATKSQNAANAKAHKDNASGLKGVCWHLEGRKWAAEIKINRKKVYLGLFDCPAAAHLAYAVAAEKYFGEFARLS